jgi:hypothetical protein
MQFSNFAKTTSNDIILLKNSIPIENISVIKYYSDNSSGSFSKKEIRWSFNNSYWSSWTTLSQNIISGIKVLGKPLYLEIRYTLSSISSGDVSSFILNYLESASAPISVPSVPINTPVLETPLAAPSLRNLTGSISFKNSNNPNINVTVTLTAGKVTLDSTITEGFFGLVGTGVLDNNAGPNITLYDAGLTSPISISEKVWNKDISLITDPSTAGNVLWANAKKTVNKIIPFLFAK